MFKLLVITALCSLITAKDLEEVFRWKQITFKWPNEETKAEAIKNFDYIPENNLPLGVGRWKDKLFITVPRWKSGVASSLAYIPLNTNEKSPDLIPYPDWKANTLPKDHEKLDDNHIISTFRIRIDECDRLWVIDTGLADILGSPKQHSKAALVIFDLNTDKLIRRYEFPPTDLKEATFFANVIVDTQKEKCDEAFAYVPDLGGYGVVVYSWKTNNSWRVTHNFFHFEPLHGDFNVGGVNFQWTDGVFGIALGKVNPDQYRTLYFHALASLNEFSVSTEVLRNSTMAQDPLSYYLFKHEGYKGNSTQTTASDLDEKTGVLFMTQVNRDGVACWNTKKPLDSESLALFAQDRETLIFPNDLKIDADRNLWLLSDKMPVFLFKGLDSNQYNYRIFKIKVDDAIASNACEIKYYEK